MSRANFRTEVVEIAYEIAALEPEDLGRLREILAERWGLIDYRGTPVDEDAARRLTEAAAEVEDLLGTRSLEDATAAFEHATGVRP